MISVLVLFLLTSCSGSASQCKQLINLINDGQSFRQDYERAIGESQGQISSAQNLEETQAAAQGYIEAFERTRENTNELTQKIAALSLSDEQLAEYRNGFTAASSQWTIGLETAEEAKELLIRAESEEEFREYFDRYQQQLNNAYATIQAADTQMTIVIDGINAYCVPEAQ